MQFKGILFFSLMVGINLGAADRCIKLNSPVLGVIDGIKGLMDDKNVHKILYLGQLLNIILYGEKDSKTKNRIPQHEYMGKKYTLEQLVSVEESVNKNSPEYPKVKAELEKTLAKLKDQFALMVKPVLLDAKGASQQMHELIDAFIVQWGDSVLKYWKIDKNEIESLHKRVVSLKVYFTMCYDLYHFLTALLCSCPKAVQMYKDSQKIKGAILDNNAKENFR